MEIIPLRGMALDQLGVIHSIKATGELGRRIRDMGLVQGTLVTVIGRAPLNDPVALRLRDFTMTLRNNEADYISVDVSPEALADAQAQSAELAAPIDGAPVEDDGGESVKTVAFIGNPNCGKSTLFNSLTGLHQHVGNYPGITVEKHEGVVYVDSRRITVVDLPGTYSLTAYSEDELVARNFLMEQNPDAVFVIMDATNLERSLYLALQIQELGMPVVFVLNMMDEVRKKGIRIDIKALSAAFKVRVYGISARTGEGVEHIVEEFRTMLREPIEGRELFISYGSDLSPALEVMQDEIIRSNFLGGRYPARWLAVKYMEHDSEISDKGLAADPVVHNRLLAAVAAVAEHTTKTLDAEPVSLVADYRYGYISSLMRGIVTRFSERRFDFSDNLDKVLTHALLGPVIMLAVLYGLFWLTIRLGAAPQGWVEDFFAWFAGAVESALPDGDLRSLINDGIIGGVGGVLSFAPLILIMFFFLSFLEDSGYLARMAYMLDRLFRIFGLHGASVVPYIISGGIPGGCAVPGVLAARTLRSPRERIATVLTAPFLSCGAKTPVFLMMSIAFFPRVADKMLFGVTFAGWLGVLVVSFFLRKTIISGPPTPFVMELPPYRIPTLRGLLTHTWERVWMYVKKAGTVILAISVLVWAGMNYPDLPEERLAAHRAELAAVQDDAVRAEIEHAHASEALTHSFAGRIGTALEPVTSPMGFDWRTNIALLGGFAAKEVIVSSLGTTYSMGKAEAGSYKSVSSAENLESAPAAGLAARLAADPAWNKSTAVAFMLFVLFYSPCFVTVAVIIREIGLKWGIFSVCFNTVFAYCIALAARHIAPFFM